MKKTRKPLEVLTILKELHGEKFGGKECGRFRIRHSDLRKLSGHLVLHNSWLQNLQSEAIEDGYVITEIGDYFCFIESSSLSSYRPVPLRVLLKYGPDYEDEDEEVDEEDDEPQLVRGLPPEDVDRIESIMHSSDVWDK